MSSEDTFVDIFDMPGGSDYTDVTGLFEAAAAGTPLPLAASPKLKALSALFAEMENGELFFTDGFELQDAMTAFEIGEVRMDTGAASSSVDGSSGPVFDPYWPLLPEEVCWLLDRSFACEMEWHSGSTLSQTIYTILYVHRLDALNPDIPLPLQSTDVPEGSEAACDRPRALMTIVLRAAMFALLKGCDAAWREMSKNRVFEGEDWQGEKCEVSMLEGIPFGTASRMLDEAIKWIDTSLELPDEWREPLRERISLRKAILNLLTTSPSFGHSFSSLLSSAREHLSFVPSHPVTEPTPDAPARMSLDPNVLGRLHAFLPLAPRTIMSQADAWAFFARWLDAWEEVGRLASEARLVSWEVVGTLRPWTNRAPSSAYVRSLTQTTFTDDILTLGRHAPPWLVNSFTAPLGVFFRFIDRVVASVRYPISPHVYSPTFSFGSPGGSYRSPTRDPRDPVLLDLENDLVQALARSVRAGWANPARRRRALARLLAQWLDVRAALGAVAAELAASGTQLLGRGLIDALPALADHRAAATARELALAGFQLDLYGVRERSSAYWWAARVCAADLAAMEAILRQAPEGPERQELLFQLEFTRALERLCAGFFRATAPTISNAPNWSRLRLNFERRHKWMALVRIDNAWAWTWAGRPDWTAFMQDWSALAAEGPGGAGDLVDEGVQLLRALAKAGPDGAGKWAGARMQFIQSLADSTAVPGETDSILKWDVTQNPWFPAR